MNTANINLRELDRQRLEDLRDAVERELENRRFEERLLWEVRRQSRDEAQPG